MPASETNIQYNGVDLSYIYVARDDINRFDIVYNITDPLYELDSGGLYVFGDNSYGQLGLGDRTNRSSPVQVGSLTNWKSVDSGSNHTVAIKTDGTLWSWGNNTYEQLGLGDQTHRSSPVQVGSLTNWKSVFVGSNHALAITYTEIG